MKRPALWLVLLGLIVIPLAASFVSPDTVPSAASAQAVPVNTGLAERELLIERAGETIARFTVEIADSPEAQIIGLTGRTELAADRGMLFVWDRPFAASMWMKHMFIPLDLVFVRANGTIAWIVHNVPPCPPQGACPSYSSPVPVTTVLEVAAGRSVELGLRIGDKLVWAEPTP